jgi:tetratricopeptide (TPR) repeat protein
MIARERQLLEAYRALAQDSKRANLDTMVGVAMQALALGQSHLAIALLKPFATSSCTNAGVWESVGLAYRDEQDMEASLDALRRARELMPMTATTAFAYAQVLLATGRDATDAFETVDHLAPNNPAVILGHASALAAQGLQDIAEVTLLSVLAREPQWLDGHKTLASLRVAAGRRDMFDDSFRDAVQACPQSISLRLAWLHLLSTARDWGSARAVLADARRDFGHQKGLELMRVHIASEAGEPAGDDPTLFDHLRDVSDPGLDLCRVRHALRLGEPARAAAIGGVYVGQANAAMFWPYLSLAWRLLGDERAEWLDGARPPIGEFDLKLTKQERAELVACLQDLHTTQAPFLEQSVHGGTQTSGQLFFSPLAPIQAIRVKIADALGSYVSSLHAPIEGHPLLSPPRDGPILFEGSWSVKLKGGGHHSTHTHPKGWISSALYVDVPPPDQIGVPPSGWISFGEGPPDLKLGLPPYRQIAPEPSKLVLFPSTMWHRTVPFEAGERLTIAFDVKVPRVRLWP